MGEVDLWALRNASVLLVGGTGFIGRHILPRLLEAGARVTILALFGPGEYDGPLLKSCRLLRGDITVPENRDAVAGTAWDCVINVGGFINQRQGRDAELEVFAGHLAHVQELVSLLAPSLSRFVHAGSAIEYGNGPAPHREGQRECPQNPYAAAKVACTLYLQMLHRSRDFPAVILRPFLVYGPGQGIDKFIPKAIEDARAGRTIRMTLGEQTRDPVHVFDVAEAFVRACVASDVGGRIINVASGHPVAMKELVRIVIEVVGRGEVDIGALDYRQGEVMRSEADIGLLREMLGLQPDADLRGNLAALL
jgi:nucleoside-diphosphate-sugar epimerase